MFSLVSSAERRASAAVAATDAAGTSSSSGSSGASTDSDDGAEQLVASAPHFVENILAVGGYAVAGNKKNKPSAHRAAEDRSPVVRPSAV